jgi:hypothetical protein
MVQKVCDCDTKFCFYNSISYIFGGIEPSPQFWVSPIGCKNFLKIGRFDKIEKHHIPILEKHLKIAIDIIGDYNYKSPEKYTKRITLTNYDGHYSAVSKKSIISKFYKTELKLKYYTKMGDDYYLTYDGTNLVADYVLKDADLKTDKNTFVFKEFKKKELTQDQQETLLEINDESDSEDLYAETIGKYMVASYDNYISQIANMKENGIDISAHGFSIKNTALALFAKFVKPYDFAEIDEQESAILAKVKNYGILYAKAGTVVGRELDLNSFYPSCYVDPRFIIPIGKPIYKKLEKLEDVISVGLYHVKITGTDPRLFLENPKHNWYCYTDVKQAKVRGWKIELICDGNPNFLFYDAAARETGFNLFRGYVAKLFPLKKKNPLAKSLLQMLWGILCEKEKKYHRDEISFDSLEQLNNTMCIGDGFVERTKIYKLPHARIGVFLTSFARNRLCDEIADVVETVWRSHTDSILTTSSKEFKISAELGQWKLEREGQFIVQSIGKKPIQVF